MTLNEVKELIELVAAKGFAEFEITQADFNLKIVAHVASVAAAAPTPQPVAQVAPAAPVITATPAAVQQAAPAAPAPAPEEKLHEIKSPIVGTFYRSPNPDSDPFVKVGDNVDRGTVLCIIEAMKLMNEIESEEAGEIVKIYVENGQPVEYGQPLFGLRV